MKRIAFITDVHLDEQFPIDNSIDAVKNFETVLADIEARNIKEVIFGGDIGEVTAHRYFFERLQNLSVNIVLGNHDKYDTIRTHFVRDIERKELYYKLEADSYQYIFLDSSVDELSSIQLKWLEQELDENRKLILVIHHPVLEISAHIDKVYPLRNREQLKSILLAFQNDVTIFCGHYHMNDEQEYKNIRQYTTQSMSFQIVKDTEGIEVDNTVFGYRIIEIDGAKIETELVGFRTRCQTRV